MRIPKLRRCWRANILRLKPVLWGTIERRKRLEAALRRAEYIVSRASSGGSEGGGRRCRSFQSFRLVALISI